MCRWIDSLNRFGFRWVPYCWRQGVRRLWAPMKIVLVQQLSGFQRAPQGKRTVFYKNKYSTSDRLNQYLAPA